MSIPKSVCYNCPERTITCHSYCVRYQKEYEKRTDSYKERIKQNDINSNLKALKKNRIESNVNKGKFCHKK